MRANSTVNRINFNSNCFASVPAIVLAANTNHCLCRGSCLCSASTSNENLQQNLIHPGNIITHVAINALNTRNALSFDAFKFPVTYTTNPNINDTTKIGKITFFTSVEYSYFRFKQFWSLKQTQIKVNPIEEYSHAINCDVKRFG